MSLKQAILNTKIKSICDIITHCQTDTEVLLKYSRYIKSTKKLITYLKDNQVRDKFREELEYLKKQCNQYFFHTLHATLL